MRKAKWIHKWHKDIFNCKTYCGVEVYDSGHQKWDKVTCPKCLSKRPETKTDLYFELDGKIYVTEKTKSGKVVSQEEIDGMMVLKYLVKLLEQGLKEYLDLDEICEYKSKMSRCDESLKR